MNSDELRHLAERTRFMREIGIALLLASGVLACVLLVTGIFSRHSTVSHITIEASTTPSAFDTVQIDAKAAIVYDLATGETLYAKNAEAQLPLASLTKLLTVYAALNELSPNTPVTVPASAVGLEAPHALREGQVFALNDLARITLTASLNDGAAAIASTVAAQENRSQYEMLAGAAASLDLAQTYAVNGNGLDVSASTSGGYGSAYDLARLAGALAAKAPDIASATTAMTATATSEGGTTISVKNTDPIVSTIPHLLLSKTGYTDLAGGNLALVLDVGLLHPVAIVVLGSSEDARFTDGSALVAATLAHFANVTSL